MGGGTTRAGATSCPRSGGFSPLSFPLGWKPALTSPVAHTMFFFFLKPILVLGIKEKTGCVCTGFGLLGVLVFSSQCHLSFMILLYMDSSTEGPVFSGPYAM